MHTHTNKEQLPTKNNSHNGVARKIDRAGQVKEERLQQLLQSGSIQAKLKVGQPNDRYEQEADRVADIIMNQSNNPTQEKKIPLQISRKSDSSGGETNIPTKLESQIDSLKSTGQPLSDSTRAFFEPRFGADFNDVRLHTDANAQKTAVDINARAFTVGNNIAFGSGQYSPDTKEGKQLLAHELTHVVQQIKSKGSDKYIIRPQIVDLRNVITQRSAIITVRWTFDSSEFYR